MFKFAHLADIHLGANRHPTLETIEIQKFNESMNKCIEEKVDFILIFWMVHEVGNQRDFFSQLGTILTPGGKILMAEPKMHVSAEDIAKTIEIARSTGLRLQGQPAIQFSHTALFEKIP